MTLPDVIKTGMRLPIPEALRDECGGATECEVTGEYRKAKKGDMYLCGDVYVWGETTDTECRYPILRPIKPKPKPVEKPSEPYVVKHIEDRSYGDGSFASFYQIVETKTGNPVPVNGYISLPQAECVAKQLNIAYAKGRESKENAQ